MNTKPEPAAGLEEAAREYLAQNFVGQLLDEWPPLPEVVAKFARQRERLVWLEAAEFVYKLVRLMDSGFAANVREKLRAKAEGAKPSLARTSSKEDVNAPRS